MNNQFEDVLDAALEQLNHEPVTAVLNHYPDQAASLEPLLAVAERLTAWQTADLPQPDPAWQTADRAAFLTQIEQLPTPTVSPNPLLRLNTWLKQSISALKNRQKQKERYAMNTLIARAVLTVMVILGIGGGTAAWASDSLPDTPLYPVKLMLEDTKMALANSPVEQSQLNIDLAEVRLQEIQQLHLADKPVNKQLLVRLETHLQQALQLAAQTNEPEMIGLLTQMQTMMQAQLNDPYQQLFAATKQILHQYQDQVAAGLENPPLFRWQQGQNPDWEPLCPQGECNPAGDAHQNGQELDNSGHHGSDDENCSGDCNPIGDENQHGHDANMPNGSGNQNCLGDGNCSDDCNSTGDENQCGHGPFESGNENNNWNGPANDTGNQNGPGDGNCTGDCDPMGGEKQHGQDEAGSGQNEPGDGNGACDNDCEPPDDKPHHDHGSGHGNGG
jgi:hypothetical protein